MYHNRGWPYDQSKRGRGGLTTPSNRITLKGRGRGTGGRVRARPYDEGVTAWLEGGQGKIGTTRDVAAALRYLCIVARSRLGISDKAERAALVWMLRCALFTLVTLGSEDPHDVGTYCKTLESYSGGKYGDDVGTAKQDGSSDGGHD